MRKCPRCCSVKFVKNGRHLEAQRYRCKPCGYQFTRKIPRGRPPEEKALAILLYTHGLSMNAVARLLGVTPPAVSRWVRDFGRNRSARKESGGPVLMELDDLLQYLVSEEARACPGKLVMALPLSSLTRDMGCVIDNPRA